MDTDEALDNLSDDSVSIPGIGSLFEDLVIKLLKKFNLGRLDGILIVQESPSEGKAVEVVIKVELYSLTLSIQAAQAERK